MNRRDPSELEDVLPSLGAELGRDAEVVFAFLHGSAQEGLPFQDLDLAVFFKTGRPLYQAAADLAGRLERLVGVPCDVHAINNAPDLFAFQASQGRLLVCRNEEALARWREGTWNRYFRYQPHRERLLRDWLGR